MISWEAAQFSLTRMLAKDIRRCETTAASCRARHAPIRALHHVQSAFLTEHNMRPAMLHSHRRKACAQGRMSPLLAGILICVPARTHAPEMAHMSEISQNAA